MKKPICAILSSIILFSAAGCAPTEEIGTTALSSSAATAAQWLTERLGDSSADITVGTAEDASSYGIDLGDLRDDGYVIRKQGGDTVIFGKTEDGLDRGVRAYAKSFTGEDYVSYTYGEGAKIKSLTIAENDISEYVIMLPEESDECHDYTADELQKYIGNACGVYPEIIAYDVDYTGSKIELVRIYDDDPLYETHGDEGFTISVENGNLTILGGYLRGCMYGAYEVLEKYIGYIFLYDYKNAPETADKNDAIIDYLAEAEHVDIPEGISDTQVSPFSYRHNICRYVGTDISYDYRAVSRDQGTIINKEKYNTFGYIYQAGNDLETVAVSGLIPNYTYYEDSQRRLQPCFTDEENLEFFIDYYKDLIRRKIDSGQQIGRDLCHIGIGQMDNNKFCQCYDCMELTALDGGFVGPVLHFTNTVAEAVEAEFGPDIYIGMLAYLGTNTVPNVTRPRKNVNVSYCFYFREGSSICTNHDLTGTECTGTGSVSSVTVSNKPYAEELRGWCEIADTVTVWYYPGHWITKAMMLPLGKQFLADFKFLADLGVDGMYSDNNCYQMTDEYILQYLMSKAAWDPYMSEEEYQEIIKDYYRVMCGDGWEFV